MLNCNINQDDATEDDDDETTNANYYFGVSLISLLSLSSSRSGRVHEVLPYKLTGKHMPFLMLNHIRAFKQYQSHFN